MNNLFIKTIGGWHSFAECGNRTFRIPHVPWMAQVCGMWYNVLCSFIKKFNYILLIRRLIYIMALDYYIPGTRGRFPNRVQLIKRDDKLTMELDITLFPIYCDGCGRVFPHFYINKGSRKGIVGQVDCPSCGRAIQVTDEGTMVSSISINDYPVDFHKLYLLDWSYIEQADSLCNGLIVKALLGKYNKSELNYLTIEELVDICTSASCIQLSGDMKFQTDTRFTALPPEINHWIEFLYRCGVTLPAYVTVSKTDHDIPSLEGSAIWQMKHMDSYLNRFPSKKKNIFESKFREINHSTPQEEK